MAPRGPSPPDRRPPDRHCPSLGFLGIATGQLSGQLDAFGIDLDGLADYTAAVAAGESFVTSNDVVTGSLGLTLLLPGVCIPTCAGATATASRR